MSREHLARRLLLALVGASCLACVGLFLNAWLQREWLASKWLFRIPWGIAGLGAAAVVSVLALLALVLALRSRRWISASASPLLWIPPLLVLAWASLWTIEPPTLVFDAELAVSVALAAWCALVAWRARRPDLPRSRGARILELAALEIAACLALAEVGLRVARSAFDLPLLATSGTDVDAWLRTHRLAPGSFHLGFPVNADGVVDVPAEEAARRARRVVVLGDSFGVGVVPHHLHYTTVAERRFEDLEAYDLAVVNSGPREYRRLLELHGPALRPDLVVVALFLGNDVVDARRGGSSPLAAWTDRDEILVLQLGKRLWRIAEDGPPTEGFGTSPREALAPLEVERRLPWLADPLREPPTLSPERFAYVEWTRAEITLPEKSGEYREALDEIARIQAAAGTARLACLLIPDEFQVEDAVWQDVERAGLSPQADRELPQSIVGKFLDERGIPFVDLLPLLRAAEPLADGRLHVYHLRDTHWNARGNRIAGEALAELIERCGVARRRP